MVTKGTNGSDFPGGRRDGAAPQSTERGRFEFVRATVEQHTTISFVTDTKAKTPTLRGPSSASRESSVVLSPRDAADTMRTMKLAVGANRTIHWASASVTGPVRIDLAPGWCQLHGDDRRQH